MMPIGPLMIEHRLIEKMVALLEKEISVIEESKKADVDFLAGAVDFYRIYADKCHHGKEEDILFRDLKKKDISAEHKQMMDELIQEHVFGRETIGKLSAAKDRYRDGDKDALKEIAESLKTLVELYPSHIEKEDKHFFKPVMEYFSQEEKDAMLQESWEFDKNLFHEIYKERVKRFEEKRQEKQS